MIEKDDDMVNLFRGVVEPYELTAPEESWLLLDFELERRRSEAYRKKALFFRAATFLLVLTFTSYLFVQFLSSEKSGNANSTLSGLNNVKSEIENYSSKDKSDRSKLSENIRANNIEKSKNKFLQNGSVKLIASSEKAGLNKVKQVSAINIPDKNGRSEKVNKKKLNDLANFLTPSPAEQKEEAEVSKAFTDVLLPTAQQPELIEKMETVGRSGQTDIPCINERQNIDSLISKSKSSEKRLTAYLFFSPDYVQRFLIDDNKADNQSESDYNKREAPDFSFTVGTKCEFLINSKWGTQLGVTYSSISQNINPLLVFAKNGNDGSPHYTLPTSYGAVEMPNSHISPSRVGDSIRLLSTTRQSIQFINLPLLVTYKLTGKKLNYYLMAGASFNFVVSEKNIVDREGTQEIIRKINGLKDFNQSLIIGLGIEYSTKSRFSYRIEPTFKRDITPINENTPVLTYPYSFGMAFCLGYLFR